VALFFGGTLTWSGGFNQVLNRQLQLPFTIPCATKSEDAAPVYVALRTRNRQALRNLSADKRMMAVGKGTQVKISSFGAVAMVAIEGGPSKGDVCFVRSDIVPVILQHSASR